MEGACVLPCKQHRYSWILAPGKEPKVSNEKKRRDALASLPPGPAPAPAKDQDRGHGGSPRCWPLPRAEDNSRFTFLLGG